jgi:biopolymer transport protein TolR
MAFLNPNGATTTSLSEINVTPLVDVMLVLLVIFMITAPILQTGIQVNLPHTRTVETATPDARVIIITIDDKSNVYLATGRQASHSPVNVNDLPKLIAEQLERSNQPKVYIRGDGDVPWRTMAYVLGLCKEAGATVSVVTELSKDVSSQ